MLLMVMLSYEKHWVIGLLPNRTVTRWMEAFKRGRIATVDLPRSGRPESAHTEVQVAVIEHWLTDERHWTVTELSAYSGISALTVSLILRKDLKIRKLYAKWVPHALGEVQKWTRYETCRINLEWFQFEGNYMLNRIIALLNPGHERMNQNYGGNQINGIVVVHHEDTTFDRIHEGHDHFGIWQPRYSRVSSCCWGPQYNLRHTLRRKRSALLNNEIIIHDNAKSHTAACVQNLLQSQSMRLWSHSEIKDAAAWEALCKQGGHFNSVSMRGGAQSVANPDEYFRYTASFILHNFSYNCSSCILFIDNFSYLPNLLEFDRTKKSL